MSRITPDEILEWKNEAQEKALYTRGYDKILLLIEHLEEVEAERDNAFDIMHLMINECPECNGSGQACETAEGSIGDCPECAAWRDAVGEKNAWGMVKERQSDWDELEEMYSKEAERAEKAEFSLGIANAALSILQNEVDTNE